MTLLQSTVPTQQAVGLPGTFREVVSSMSAINTDSLSIPFGCVVVQNKASGYLSDRQAAKLGTVATDTVLGIVGHNDVATNWVDATGLLSGKPMYVVRSGVVLVRVEDAVVKGARAYFRITAHGGLTQLGAIRSDADTVSSVDTAVILKGAFFEHSAGAGELVWLRFNDAAIRAGQS